MTVDQFFGQFVNSPSIKTVHIEAKIWDSIPFYLYREFMDDGMRYTHYFHLADLFMSKPKRLIFHGPYGKVEFKRRESR